MKLVWRAVEWRHHRAYGYHLAEAEAERALCGTNLRGASIEPEPALDACCPRCETLAVIAGHKVPATFRKRKDETQADQLGLL